jgi:hypothetical protein
MPVGYRDEYEAALASVGRLREENAELRGEVQALSRRVVALENGGPALRPNPRRHHLAIASTAVGVLLAGAVAGYLATSRATAPQGSNVFRGPVVFKAQEPSPGRAPAAPEARVEPAPAALDAQRGYLTVVCLPGCDDVYQDGERIGPSPIFKRPVVPGPHAIRLVTRGEHGATKVVQADVPAGEVFMIREAMGSTDVSSFGLLE